MTTNQMMNRLLKENTTIIKHDDSDDYFASGYENDIYVPRNADLTTSENQFSMAHELGHVYQFQHSSTFKKRANMYCRSGQENSGVFHSIIFSFFLLWIELDAWVKGWQILKEEGIKTKGYILFALKCYQTYLISEVTKTCLYIIPSYPIITLLGYFVTENVNWHTFWLDSVLVYGCILFIWETANVLIVTVETWLSREEKTA